jgi:uncharacterized flavoprotein (TIGR03862 family)
MSSSDHSPVSIAIVGSGPAGLMAATQLVLSNQHSRFKIDLYEKRAGFGRKLLIAGSSGLNISHEHSLSDFSDHYEGWTPSFWQNLFQKFGPEDWINFIEKKLGMETFLGTSQRYFVKEMKASNLLKQWVHFLESKGVTFHSNHEMTDFSVENGKVKITFNDSPETTTSANHAVFFLGGASWEKEEPSWASLFRKKNISMIPFEPSNVGYEISWSEKLLQESEGKPLKKVELHTRRGRKLGELVITQYGIEGTPVYFCGTSGPAHLDLKPDISTDQVLEKLLKVKENLSPIRRVKRTLGLCEAAESLLFHHAPPEAKTDLRKMAEAIKQLPIQLNSPRPLIESISSRGGVALTEVTPSLELVKYPNIYCGGEMLDWDAPTGGFLIQACVSQGAFIAYSLIHSI